MKSIKVITFLFILFSTIHSHADTIRVKAGDVMACDVLEKYLGLNTPYQNLFFISDYVVDITHKPDQLGQFTITTINNDSFTGYLINPQIEVLMETGAKIAVPAKEIKGIHLEAPAFSLEQKTTVFVMNNGDRFSGQVVPNRLNIRAGQRDLVVDGMDIQQVVFVNSVIKSVEINLNDGSTLTGVIRDDLFKIFPDSAPPIDIAASQLQSIQFNDLKYIKQTITPAEYLNPELCLFKCRMGFLSDCCPKQTTAVLVPDPEGHVGELEVQTEGGKQVITESRQAVVVKNEKEAPPPPTVLTEQQIRDMFGKALEAEPPVPKKFILYFIADSTDLVPDSITQMPDIIQCIRDRDSFDIRVNGHSDRAGNYKHNLNLSLKRALHVKQLLVQEGVNEKHITTSSHGEGNPLIPTKDGVAQPQNRRVEVIVR